MATPRTGKRVVCTFWVTIETLAPTRRLVRVDLPALGAPMMAAKPARVVMRSFMRQSSGGCVSMRLGGGLLGLLLASGPRRARARSPGTRTSTVKAGAWPGPSRPTTS